jgi:hypothetical protein
MKKTILFMFLLITTITFSQTTTVEKQIQIDDEDNLLVDKVVASFGKSGFSYLSRNKEMVDGKRVFKVQFYSNDLEKIEEKEIKVQGNTEYKETTIDENSVFYSFHAEATGLFVVLSYNLLTKESVEINTVIPKAANLEASVVLDGVAYYSFTSTKEDFILMVDPKKQEIEKKTIVFDIKENRKKRVNRIQVDKDSKELYFQLEVGLTATNGTYYLVVLDAQAEVKKTIELLLDEANICSATIKRIENDKYFIAGNFSTGVYSFLRSNYRNNEAFYKSDGIFSLIVSNDVVEKSNLYKYSEMKDYFSYFTDEDLRIHKLRLKASTKLEFNDYFSFQNLKAVGNDILLIGEGFEETSRSTANNDYFNGYQYNLSFFAKFDKNAELIWTKTKREKFDYAPMHSNCFLEVNVDSKSNISCSTINDFSICNYIIDSNGNVNKEDFQEISETDLNLGNFDKLETFIDFWYDKYYFAYTSHKVINNSTNKKGKVITVSKIKF